jgi:hypothetical protein
MLKLDNILLYLLTDISEDNVVVSFVFVSAKFAIECLINLAAILNLSILVELAEEPFRVIGESLNFIEDLLITFDFFGSWTELLKSVHWVIVWVIPRGKDTRLDASIIVWSGRCFPLRYSRLLSWDYV